MIEKQTKIFTQSGLNQDDDLDLLQGNDCRYRWAMGFINGNYDDLIPRHVPDALGLTLPGTTNTVIGVAHDAENDAAILFVYGELGANYPHSIIRLYSDGTQENIVFGWETLNFDDSYPIYNPVVIGSGDGALLAWTDNYNPPRLIHIKNFIDGVYTSADAGNSYLHKPAPTEKPTLTLSYDSNVDYSRLTGNLFQFAYRWVYDTGQRSVLSPWSDTVYDYEDDFFDEAILDVVNNYIRVTAGTDDWDNLDKVEFFVRELDVGSGAPGTWKLFDTIDIDGATEYTDFYNDEDGVYYDDIDVNRLNDDVPLTARTLEFINGNRIALGGFNLGRDPITPDITLEQVEVAIGDETYLVADTIEYDTITSTDTADFDILLTWGEENHVIVELSSEDGSDITTETYIVKSDANYNAGSESAYYNNNLVIDALVKQINNNTAFSITASRSAGGGMTDLLHIVANVGTDHINISVFVTNVRTKLRSMKENAKSYFAVEYIGSNGRTSRVYLNDGTNIQVVRGTSVNSNAVESQIGIKYTIAHEPPDWASYWRFLYGGSSIPSWFYLTARFHHERQAVDDYRIPELTMSKGRMRLDLTEALNRIDDKFGYTVQTFTPVAGDYIRLVGYAADGDPTILTATPQQEMYPIVEVTEESGSTIIYFYSSDFDTPRPIVLLEIFRQQELTDVESITYKEVGDVMSIVGGYHHCTVPTEFTGEVTATNQADGVDGVGVIDFGNCYIYPVYWDYGFDVEPSYLYSDKSPFISRGEFMSSYLTRDSNHFGQGRSNYSSNETNKDYNAVLTGGTFNDQNLDYNELNKFTLDTNESDLQTTWYLNDKYGDIYGIREMGDSLYVIQRSKVTPYSLGGRRRMQQDDGSYVTVYTNEILADNRPFDEDFGTVFSGSICKYANRIWFFDPLNSAVWQLAQNGLTDISRFKMKSLFRSISDGMDGAFTSYEFKSFYDVVTDAYVLMYIDTATPANNWSLSFYPAINKWGCYDNYKYGGAISLAGNKVFSFDSDAYEHHKSGEDYEESYTDVHFNDPKLERKLWKMIESDSDYQYVTAEDPSIWVDTGRPDYTDTGTYIHTGSEQRSLIPTSRYKRVNGKYRAAFLRNKLLNDGSAGTAEKLYNGDILSGKHITIRLTNSKTDAENKLRAVTVGFQRRRK